MPLATKNNAIIVKDGKLAENCGCCGGWYCVGGDQSCVCPTEAITAVTVDITAGDFLLHGSYKDISGSTWHGSYLSMLSRLDGVHSLVPSNSTRAYWTKSFSPFMQNIGGCVYCNDGTTDIKVSLEFWGGRTTINVTLCSYWASIVHTQYNDVPNYFAKGDTARFGSDSIVFGDWSRSTSGVGDTYNPYDQAGPRAIWWNTSAWCWQFRSECINGQRSWSPSIPATATASDWYNGALNWIPMSTIDSVSGKDSFSVNSILLSY